jgi:hypothetical protein
MAKLQLDTTLADLYRENGIEGQFIVTMYCVFGQMDLHPSFPRELVYPEDEEPVPFTEGDEKEKARLRRLILGLKPLRRAVGLGDMDVLFFGPNITQQGMQRAMAQLPPHQRHRPRFIDLDKGDFTGQVTEACRGKKLLFWRPQGWMRDQDCLVDPQLGYDINSKKCLVTSGIRTPKSEVISLQQMEDLDTEDGDSCGDADENDNNNHIQKRTNILRTRPLPFVVKLCRAGCGFGTFIATTEAQRRDMLASMRRYRARGVDEVLVSEYIDLVQDLSVHFVIGGAGSAHNHADPLILGVTVQSLTPGGKWVGGHIDYGAQASLHALVRETVRDTARRIPRGFVGLAGVDIVVDRAGAQYVVDLNARFTGSMPICFMSQHFWRDRSLPLAKFGAFGYAGDVDSIYERLQPLIYHGQVIVTATASIYEGDNMADIVWGGKDSEELDRVEKWIKSRLAEEI